MQTAPTATSPAFDAPEFPADSKLPDLPRLFDAQWVWQRCAAQLPIQRAEPTRIRIRHFIHSIGRSAIVSYELEWAPDAYLPSEYFVAALRQTGKLAFWRFPDDERLPGLAEAASPEAALRLVNKTMLSVPARRARVQLIRYRPTYRAVIRHRIGSLRLYARVVRPQDFAPLLAAYETSRHCDFHMPDLAGQWAEGGIIFLTEVPGRDLRSRIRKGKAPEPELILAGLESLWRLPGHGSQLAPFDLKRAYRRALRSFRHNLRDHPASLRELNEIAAALAPFVEAWQPASMAHNDFYDDQLLALPGGGLALVDFEAIAPGEAMLDIGNFLAHLRWSTRFARPAHAKHCRRYYYELREAALKRFGWHRQDLALREAVCLFRVCTNAIRHPGRDWLDKLSAGLALVGDCLG